MPKIETIQSGGGGGGVGAKKDAEGFRNSYAVKALTDLKTLKMLADLPVFDANVKGKDEGITFELDELMALGYAGDTPGAPMQFFDRILDTLGMPFIAGTIARGGVKKVKVIRYGDEFDASKYATTRAGRPSYKVEMVDGKEVKVQDGLVDHEDSPEGLVVCLEEWLGEVAQDELFTPELIEKLGLTKKMTELDLLEEEAEEEIEEETK